MKALAKGRKVGEEPVEQGETVAAQRWAEKGLFHSSERYKEQESPNLTQDCNSFEMFWWNHSSYPLKLMIRRAKWDCDPWFLRKIKEKKEKRKNFCVVRAPGLFQGQNSWMYFLLTHVIGMYVLADFIILAISITIIFRETVGLWMQMCYIRLVMHTRQLFQQKWGEK